MENVDKGTLEKVSAHHIPYPPFHLGSLIHSCICAVQSQCGHSLPLYSKIVARDFQHMRGM